MSTHPLTQAPRPDDTGPDTLIVPGSPEPLSPGRVTIHPDREAGVDELPNNEGNHPHPADDPSRNPERVDMDLDNAEFDEQPNPR